MTAQDFVYWLNGFVELGGDKEPPTAEQWKSIVEHLQLMMNKVTPPVGQPTSAFDKVIKEIQDKLDRKADKHIQPYPFTPGISPSFPGVDNSYWLTNPPGIVTC